MRHCCDPSGLMTPLTMPFLIHLVTVARSTLISFATSEADRKDFTGL